MNEQETKTSIGRSTRLVAEGTRRLNYQVLGTAQERHQQKGRAQLDRWKKESEPFARSLLTEQDRILRQIVGEIAAASQLSAGHARYLVEPAYRDLAKRYPAFVASCRRDVGRSFPGALNHVDANGMLTFHLLTETLRPVINNATASELLQRHYRALAAKDARGLIEEELIEERLGRGGIAAKDADLPVLVTLRESVELIQGERVPYSAVEQAEIEETITFARRTLSLADLAYVRPLSPQHPDHERAKAAFDAEEADYRAAIEAAAEALQD